MNYQGDVARDQGDIADARTLYEQGLAIFRELDDRWGIAGTLADLGSLAREEGNYPGAQSMYRESIKLFRELDYKRGIARVLECFACAAAAQLQSRAYATAGGCGGCAASKYWRSAHARGTGQTGSQSAAGTAGLDRHSRCDGMVGRRGFAGRESR
jgi:tetratricopeptide (TPR) repeat protein